MRRHEDDRPVVRPQPLDRLPPVAAAHEGRDLVERAEQRPDQFGRTLADLGGVRPCEAADRGARPGEPAGDDVVEDARAIARREQVNEAAEKGAERVVRPKRQPGERAKKGFQMTGGRALLLE